MLRKLFKRRKEKEVFIDLSKLKSLEEERKKIEEAKQEETSQSFLSTLALSASNNEVVSNVDPETVERIRRRIDRISERLDLLEHKIERLERRLDLKY